MSLDIAQTGGPNGLAPVIVLISPSGKSSALDNPKAWRIDVPRTESGEYRIQVGLNLMATESTSGVCRLKVWIR